MSTPQPRAVQGRAAAGLAASLIALALLLPLATPADGAMVRRTADQPRVGYPLRDDGTAAGGWFGSRTAGRTVVFRLDPGAAPTTPGFGAPHAVSILHGRGPVHVDRRRTSRAAWVLAKFGTYRSRAQAAAVELALDNLLYGGRYGIDGTATKRRLRQVRDRDTVRGMVSYMLDKSASLAGPYRVQVEAQGGLVTGERVPVTVTVTAARGGAPIAHLPVELTLGGPVLARETNQQGQVSVLIASNAPGPQPLVATVRLLPADTLLVRSPTSGRGSRIALAGRKLTRTATKTVTVVAQPIVSMDGPGASLITDAVPGQLTVAGGYQSPRTATFALHGPLPLGSAPGCAADTVHLPTVTQTVTTDGTYALPTVSAPSPGVYNWSVALAGDTYNQAAVSCGDTFRVRAVPTFAVRPTKDQIAAHGEVKVRATAGALPADYTGRVTARLYGPFATRADVRCVDAKIVRWRFLDVTGPSGAWSSTAVTLDRPGVYAWQATLPGKPLSLQTSTACRAANTFVRVG